MTNVEPGGIDYSSIDLTLAAADAYKLTTGSVKPTTGNYLHWLRRERLITRIPQVDGCWTLQPRTTYLFKLAQELHLPKESRLYGQATAKSSVGRVDVLARLIVEGMRSYEGFTPGQARRAMFVEITPMTFVVRVRPTIAITQLRLFLDPPEQSLVPPQAVRNFVISQDPGSEPAQLSVDLTPSILADEEGVAFVAKESPPPTPVDLWHSDDRPDPRQYWDLVGTTSPHRLVLAENRFHILRSLERLRVPKNLAVYCRATDETIGEMRIHYAGFVHPFFGRLRDDMEGTPLIFEVRGHDVPVNLTHGETLARLSFYRLSEDCQAPAGTTDPYEFQTLKLSKFFAEWGPR